MDKARPGIWIRSALLAGMLSVPASAGAFWAGPGCLLANMLGGGMFSGGMRMSMGMRGPGYGYPWGVMPPYGSAYPIDPHAAWQHHAPPGSAPTPRRAVDVLPTNIWSPGVLEPTWAPVGDTALVPRNRW